MAYPDKLYLKDPMIRVEVKSSQNGVGVDEVRALNGALRGNEWGLFVARGGFSKQVVKRLSYFKPSKIVFIRSHAASLAATFAGSAFGSSPSRMKACPAPS